MDYLEIEGGSPLCGEVRIQGSKNAALPILSAALLNPGITVLKNCPDISDVSAMLEILEGYGCVTGREKGILFLDASELRPGQAKKECAGKMRSSIMLLGSLLGRLGEVYLPYPGGCVIGRRPIDLHLWALRQMGAEVWEEEEGLRAVCAKPKAAELRLPFPVWARQKTYFFLQPVQKARQFFTMQPESRRLRSCADFKKHGRKDYRSRDREP